MSTFHVHDIVEIAPADDLDPMSVQWTGIRAVVVSVKQDQAKGSYHVRVEDLATKHRGTFRETDLKKSTN